MLTGSLWYPTKALYNLWVLASWAMVLNEHLHYTTYVYKGWLTRDEIWRLVDFEKIIRDGDYFFK